VEFANVLSHTFEFEFRELMVTGGAEESGTRFLEELNCGGKYFVKSLALCRNSGTLIPH